MSEVIIARGQATPTTYHLPADEADCHMRERIQKPTTITRRDAELRGLEACRYCTGQVNPGGADWSIYRRAVEAGRNE